MPSLGAVSQFLLFLALWCGLSGCSEKPARPGEEAPRPAAEVGSYGALVAAPHTNLAKARPPRSLGEVGWNEAGLAVLQTELSPAILVRCTSSYLGLFRDMESYQLEGPRYVALSSRAGPRAFAKGKGMDVIDMEECWLVLWFQGGRGWVHWDSPWAVFLQHKPLAMTLDDAGLHLRFRQPAGDVVLLPLYGYEKLPVPGQNVAHRSGLSSETVRTEQWTNALPQALLMRVRYWAGAMREFPLYCEDQFSVDRSAETVTLRQRYQWYSIQDAWNTAHLKLAPISPVLALAMRDRGFPARFSKPITDLDLCTPYGPYAGVEGADVLDIELPFLKYVHESERPVPPDPAAHPAVGPVLTRFRDAAQALFPEPALSQDAVETAKTLDQAGPGNLWLAKALPFFEPAIRTRAQSYLRAYLQARILSADLTETTGQWTLEMLWAYAQFSGDWDFIRAHWSRIKQRWVPPAAVRWVGFGRDGLVALADGAGPWLALARLAYRVGDADTYHYACCLFARELVLQYAQVRGVEYFREHQPWHSPATLEPGACLTCLRSGTLGWQIDNPHPPGRAGENLAARRWAHFHNEDLARFYRDYLRPQMRRELSRFSAPMPDLADAPPTSGPLPSLVQLRSLLLNAPFDPGTPPADPTEFSGPLPSLFADCLSIFRTSHPIQYERLVPAAKPGPFLLGVERDMAGSNPDWLLTIQTEEPDPETQRTLPIWPRLAWGGSWRTPSGDPWNFGHIMSAPEGAPPPGQFRALNWNTLVFLSAPRE